MAKADVEIVLPKATWPAEYADIAARLKAILGRSVLAIDHIGSTSVPGLMYGARCPEQTIAMGHLSGVGVGYWHTPYCAERSRRMTTQQQARLTALVETANRSVAEEREYRTLCWFTDYADPVRGWELAAEDALLEQQINTEANTALTEEANRWTDDVVREQARGLTMPCWFITATAIHGRSTR